MKNLGLYVIVFLLVLTVCFGGCGSTGDSDETTGTTKAADTANTTEEEKKTADSEDETEAQQTEDGLEGSSSEEDDPEESSTEEVSLEQIRYCSYDGRAWIMGNDGICSCYEENGTFLFSLPEGLQPATVYTNGYTLVMEEDERGIALVSSLIDSEGNTVFTAEEMGADGIIVNIYDDQPEGSFKNLYTRENTTYSYSDFQSLQPVEDAFLDDGYILLYTVGEENYEGAHFFLGVVDTNGDWVIEMTEDTPVTEMGAYTPGEFLEHLVYVYEGNWIWIRDSYGNGMHCQFTLMNMFTGVSKRIIGGPSNVADIEGLHFSNGVAYQIAGGDNALYYVDDEGNCDLVIDPNSIYLYYYDYETDTAIAHGDYEDEDDVLIAYDSQGNIKFISHYYTGTYVPFGTEDGVILDVLVNDSRTPYLLALDTDGNMLFEPVELYKYSSSTEKALYWDSDYIITSRNIYDMEGNLVRERTEDSYQYELIGYRNGVLKYEVDSSDYIWKDVTDTEFE